MDYLLPITALVGIWAFLSLLGSERERRNRNLDRQIAYVISEQARLAAEAAALAEKAARSQAPSR